MRAPIAALLTSLVICAPSIHRAVYGPAAAKGSACGPGTIAFRAALIREKRFMCHEGSWYDGGYRDYLARLSQPVKAKHVTLLLVHQQEPSYGGGSGILLTKEVSVKNTGATTLRGTIDFSRVYFVSAPAGAPPFGTYTLSIYRGLGVRSRMLARGQFMVIED